jgi:Tol biopolymer transport system component
MPMKRFMAVAISAAMSLLGLAAVAGPARAAFAGANGRIAFTSSQTGELQIYTIRADGSGLRELTRSSLRHVRSFFPDWSPGGRRLAFDSQNQSDHPQIWVMRAGGSRLHQVTHLRGFPQAPSWSPDASRLVFELRPATGCCPNIFSIRLNGTGLHQITHFTKDVDPREPEYSPGGGRIVFAASPAGRGAFGGPYALYLIRSDGTSLRRVTAVRMDAAHPGWSPHGSVIVFNNDFRKLVGDIFTIHPDGTHLTRLTHVTHKDQADFDPDYSPGGRRIIFANFNPDEPSSVWIMRANGSGAHLLDSGQAFAPDWGSKP